jgi:hypothetical protein
MPNLFAGEERHFTMWESPERKNLFELGIGVRTRSMELAHRRAPSRWPPPFHRHMLALDAWNTPGSALRQHPGPHLSREPSSNCHGVLTPV